MSKEEIYAKYLDLTLNDKLIISAAILYDLDVGDYSAPCEDRKDDWDESFKAIIEHLEYEIGKRLSNDAITELERNAKLIKKDH